MTSMTAKDLKEKFPKDTEFSLTTECGDTFRFRSTGVVSGNFLICKDRDCTLGENLDEAYVHTEDFDNCTLTMEN